MSQNPSDLPPYDYPPSGVKPPSTILARSSMILGILSLVLCAQGIGLFIAPVALLLGVMALLAIARNPVRYGGKAMAAIGIGTGIAMFLLLGLLYLAEQPHQLSDHSVCAANVRGIMQSLVVYAADNAESYPYLGPATIAAKPALEPAPGGLMNDMFILVANGQVGAKQFLCKGDPARTATSNTPAPTGPTSFSFTYWQNPTGKSPNLCFSYSFAFQYASPTTLGDWWRNTVDAGVPIAADMNPGNQSLPGKTIRNSLNHQGDGQNVGFGDAHSEFCRTPLCGENNDHLYNIGPRQTPTAPGIGGMPFPPPAGNTQGAFDTCLEPLILNTTAYTRG